MVFAARRLEEMKMCAGMPDEGDFVNSCPERWGK